jgi:hypothetical protein
MATGASTHASTPAFHADDLEETTNYRKLSVLAIIGLLIGLASPLCFGAPLLMTIPIAGIIISILALRQIAASDGTLAGRWAAATGLALCVAFAVAPFTRGYVLQAMRTQQADAFGRQWLSQMAAGKTEQAYRMTNDSIRRLPPPEPGDNTPRPDPYTTFLGQPLVKALTAAGPDAEIRPEQAVSYEAPSFQRVYVRQRYRITPKAGAGDTQPLVVDVTMQRAKLPGEDASRWLIFSLDDPNKPAPAPDTHQH